MEAVLVLFFAVIIFLRFHVRLCKVQMKDEESSKHKFMTSGSQISDVLELMQMSFPAIVA